MRDFGDEDEISMNQGGEDMGGWWVECGSSREMILSVFPQDIDIAGEEEGYYIPANLGVALGETSCLQITLAN